MLKFLLWGGGGKMKNNFYICNHVSSIVLFDLLLHYKKDY